MHVVFGFFDVIEAFSAYFVGSLLEFGGEYRHSQNNGQSKNQNVFHLC